MDSGPTEISVLLADWRLGNESARDKVIPLVYDQLRRMASYHMAQERPGHSLQATGLIHEVYIRLADQREAHCRNRAEFFAVASRIMRHVLIDYARGRRRAKRGGGLIQVSMDHATAATDERATELIALDEALTELAAIDSRRSLVVELRYFGGLTVEQTAEVIAVSPPTVVRDWNTAKAWLSRAIKKQGLTASDRIASPRSSVLREETPH